MVKPTCDRAPFARLAVLLALPLVSCVMDGGDPKPASTVVRPQPNRAEALAEAQRCGETLGIAVRCNLVRDEIDFAVLRWSVLHGLTSRHSGATSPKEVSDIVDLGTLDRMMTIGQCPKVDLERIAEAARISVSSCARS